MPVSLPDTEYHTIFVGKINTKFFLYESDRSKEERLSFLVSSVKEKTKEMEDELEVFNVSK